MVITLAYARSVDMVDQEEDYPQVTTITMEDGALEGGCFGEDGGTYDIDGVNNVLQQRVRLRLGGDVLRGLRWEPDPDARSRHRAGRRVPVLLPGLDQDQ